jgi:glycerol-3-phosphate acyltransferase PlsY
MVAVALLLAYALGTLPTAIVVGARRGIDPTAAGSGNPGATNMYRTGGRRAGAMVLVVDLLKGAIPAAAGLALDGSTLGLAMGAAAVVGHVFPVQRRFRGGKGVATAAGVGVVVMPAVTAALAVVFVVTAKLTGRASIASITISVLWPVAAALAGFPTVEVVLTAFIGALVILRHRSNIRRLIERDEPRTEP